MDDNKIISLRRGTPQLGTAEGAGRDGTEDGSRARPDPASGAGEARKGSPGPTTTPNEDRFWFLDPAYEPMPQFTVRAGEYKFCYRPEYEPFFIAVASETGATLVSISAQLGVPFSVIKYWSARIKNFAVALDIAQQNAQAYWEDHGLSKLTDRRFNSMGWLKMMGIRFPDHWREIADDAMVTAPDPYGFVEELSDDSAITNTQTIFARLLRIKEAEEEGTPSQGEAG